MNALGLPTGALADAAAALARCLTHYRALRSAIAGTLPLPAAEALMDDIEDQLDLIGVKLQRAHAVLEREIGRIEAAS